MEQNKLGVSSKIEIDRVNEINKINKINNINIDKLSKSQYTYINKKTGYCSKCLEILGENKVIDVEGNEFCDNQCRREYWLEINQHMYDLKDDF